jgi:hypothetical protein
MSHCKVFNPMEEIAKLTKRVEQLEEEVLQLRRSVETKAVGTFVGWHPDSFSKSYDSFQVNYKLYDEEKK